MNENIVSVKKQHILKCSELYVKVFNAEPWNDKWTLKTAHKRLNDIYNSPSFEGIAYVEDGQVKGAVFGNCEQFFDGIHYNLREMFVSNELQGKGIESTLMSELEKQLKKFGVTSIIPFTSKRSNTISFYLENNLSKLNGLSLMGKRI